MIEKARQFAIEHHGDQMYGDNPYVYHLDSVVELLEPFGEIAQVAGYLHDVVEDTHATLKDIEAQFGAFIAELVEIVTDEDGDSRSERKTKTYALMSQVSGEAELALVVKVADRLANISASVEFGNKKKFTMYQKEHAIFRQSAYRPGLCDELWERIESLLDS